VLLVEPVAPVELPWPEVPVVLSVVPVELVVLSDPVVDWLPVLVVDRVELVLS
jgi:hypothetical protein